MQTQHANQHANQYANQHANQYANQHANQYVIHLQIINDESSVRPKYIEEHPQLS